MNSSTRAASPQPRRGRLRRLTPSLALALPSLRRCRRRAPGAARRRRRPAIRRAARRASATSSGQVWLYSADTDEWIASTATGR